ncbi:UDP-glucose 4-epimerase GalE [Agrobacterium sp. ES01]|uniref:UDP-glucose 4-epimerase GalE n=1 Tax=Agrobacterium sp. ES01 TaxID=3420714 RepID=UPI003D09BF4F
MAILVTGGAGYIGSHMVWALLDQGHDVVVVDRLSTGFRWAVAPKARFYKGDIGDSSVLKQIFAENAIDAVIHFAGSVVVPDSVSDPLDYYDNNTGNTRVLLSAMVEAGVTRIIFSSTAAVYGTPAHTRPIRETETPRPENPYGQSKLMTEFMLRDAANAYDLRYVALRYFNVAGADPKGRTGQSTRNATHLIKVACETALGEREKISVYGTDYATPDGTGVRDYIHVSDLVAAHLDALAYLQSGGEPLIANCGYGQGFSVLDVLHAVERASGNSIRIDYAPRRPGDAAFVVADATLARTKLGWVPVHGNLDFIVNSALEWQRGLSGAELQDIAMLQRKLAASAF